MKGTASKLFMAVLIIATIIILIGVLGAGTHSSAQTDIKVLMLGKSLGLLVATLSAYLLVARAAGGQSFNELTPLSLPLLAGVLISGGHWAVAITLGIIITAWIVRTIILREPLTTPDQSEEKSPADK